MIAGLIRLAKLRFMGCPVSTIRRAAPNLELRSIWGPTWDAKLRSVPANRRAKSLGQAGRLGAECELGHGSGKSVAPMYPPQNFSISCRGGCNMTELKIAAAVISTSLFVLLLSTTMGSGLVSALLVRLFV